MEIRLTEVRSRRERRSPPLRGATIEVLIEQLFVVQKVGQWLAHETHGDAYVRARELNELFHEAHRQLRDIKNGTTGASKLRAPGAAFQAALR